MNREGAQAFLDTYKQHPMVAVPRVDAWFIMMHPDFVEEINKAPEDVISNDDNILVALQVPYTLRNKIIENPYHKYVIQNQLTKNLVKIFEDIHDEIPRAWENLTDGHEWKRITMLPAALQLIAQTSNRVFVGAPLCRDQRWKSAMTDGTTSIVKLAALISLFPPWARPIVGRILSHPDAKSKEYAPLVAPLVEERLKMDPEDRPDDFISWLLELAPPEDQNALEVTRRLIGMNFAAVHTTSMNLTHAIFWLLARPEYIEPLRAEIAAVTEEMGWTKDALTHMVKLDSFMKESVRITPISSQALSRIVMKPFTFSNGVRIPAGYALGAHMYGTHHDPNIYENPEEFKGDRFLPKTDAVAPGLNYADDEEREASLKRSMYAASKTYLGFSYGKHVCPGRFFASMELKTMVAHLLMEYEIKWPEEVSKGAKHYRPENMWFGGALVPNPTAEILIRKRR